MNFQSYIHKPILVILMFVILSTNTLFAQQYGSLYWMQGIPQSSYSNPGIQPKPGLYIGLPAASSIYFGLDNSGFAISNVLKKNPDGSLFIDDLSLLSSLNEKNFILSEYQHEILGFGFRSGRDYISFNFTNKVGVSVGYPHDLLALAIRGNDYFLEQNLPANLSGLRADVNHYHEIGIGYSRNWTDAFTAGIRFKTLFGLGNANFTRSELTLTTQPETYALQLQSDLRANTSFPYPIAPIDSLGNDNDEFELDFENYFRNTGNLGFGIDLGASYRINDKFTIAASVLDLGFINWKTDVENFAMTGFFEFEGIDFNDFFSDDQDVDPFEQLLDSLSNSYAIVETMNAYRSFLPTKVFLSLAFHPTTMHTFALLGRGAFYSGTFQPSVTASYNFQPISLFGTSLSYSLVHMKYHSVGFGFHFNFGPLQLYTVVDNFWPALRPHTLQSTAVHLGLNIVTGYRKKDHSAPSFRWQR
jgi:hypothetical protein